MTLYFIKFPEVSSGFRKIINKKLEVFKGEVTTDSLGIRQVLSDTVYRYNAKKDTWTEHTNTRELVRLYQFPTYGPNVFDTLEKAQIAKLVAIQKMALMHQAELARLQELFKRNVPDVSKPLQTLRENHPEHFL